jgi:hypothetical protein
MKTFALLLGVATLGLILTNQRIFADDKVIVHEWGTFTSLQDENGQAIGGINVDDEPVPEFVWGAYAVRGEHHKDANHAGFDLPPHTNFSKGWMPADQDVTMRLETPVIYFYPPKGIAPSVVPALNVHVDFCGGLLSQYYPYAQDSGFPSAFPRDQKVEIGDYKTGLDWMSVRLGSMRAPVKTDEPVWTTPRETAAAPVEVMAPVYDGKGGFNQTPQSEHFLFYRGIGHLDSPLTLIQKNDREDKNDRYLMLRQTVNGQPVPDVFSQFRTAWIVEIRGNGLCAFRSAVITPSTSDLGYYGMGKISTHFDARDFSTANLAELKDFMHDALVKEGLYDDEATAMLKTWDLSYFKSPGLRFFYMVPRAWVDKELPLTITGATTQITRVMVGRIELISDDEKAALARMAAGPVPNLNELRSAAENALDQRKLSVPEKRAYYGGEKPLSDLGIPIPLFVQDYLSLGRFRDALIVHEQQTHPSPVLAQFIKENQLLPQ